MKALSLQNLKKTYKGGVVALRNINLDVEEGDFFGLLGPNGAGKSTAIGIVCSLVTRTGGRAETFGHDIEEQPWEAKRQLGLVPQEFNFNGFETVEQIVMNQAGYYGISRRHARPRCERYLRELGLWEKRKAVSRTLSGGMKRRLMIVRALIHEPRLLILDEPTAGVDIELRRSMWRFLEKINRDDGVTIILTTHYLEEAESLCRNIAIIDDGQIIENTDMQSLLSRLSVQTFILDLSTTVDRMPEIPGYALIRLSDTRIEVEVHRHQSLTELFAQLAQAGLHIVGMKNKANRLEELFLRILDRNAPKLATTAVEA
ncbi:MAG: ABC transporter ATP-binding protein [Aquisalimonadaceae bacterium]